MAAMIPSESLERLVALGQSRGHLTTEDLAGALPVDAMSPDEIALIVVHLEDAGVPVELDESLLTGRPLHPSGPAKTPEIVLADHASQAPGPDHSRLDRSGTPAAPLEDRTPPHPRPSGRWGVALACLLIAASLIFVALLLTR